MAFPVPSHLPRKATSQDISSRILTKVSSATVKTLNADLAASWVSELDETILESKTKIHERIRGDLPLLEQQLASSKTVRERLAALTANVNELEDAVSHPELGTIPSLLRTLSAHAALAQQTQDTETTYDAMESLLQCRKEYDTLVSLANDGRLDEAVEASARLQGLLDAAPRALTASEVFSNLKVAFRTVRDRVEEQLNDAYTRSLVLSNRELAIWSSVQVRQSTTVLNLPSILSSISETSLSNHLAVLRRDINAYYVDHLLTNPTSLKHSSSEDPSGISWQKLSLLPSPSTAEEDLTLRLKNMAAVLDFLNVHLFAALPPTHVASFKKTLCKPITAALLQQFLVSHLPSSLAALPSYLHLVRQAKELEEKYIVNILGQDPRDREIKTWVDAVSSHYERKRRAQILEDARQMILRQDSSLQIRIEVDLPPTPLPGSIPAIRSPGSGSDGAQDVNDDAWGLEGEESGDTDDIVSATEEEDGWGFDDAPTEPQLATSEVHPKPIPPRDTLAGSEPVTDDSAWGWDDEGEESNAPATTSPQASSSEKGAEWDDDPWGESSDPSPPPSAPPPAPKPASRLEKLASKAKAKATPQHSPPTVKGSPTTVTRQSPPATAGQNKLVETNNTTLPSKKEPPRLVVQAETYVISGRAQELADTVDGILREGEEFASTTIFDFKASTEQQQTRGSVILQTAPAVLDLFRALYPVRFGQPAEPKRIVFANDCIYARGRALSAAQQCVGAKDRLVETADSLEAIGKRWYERSIDMQQDLVADSLKKASGFVGTAEQDHYDECEEAVMGVLSHVRRVARQWKDILNKSKYFDALGSLVNFCLTSVMGDILALPDITEVESHRLSELCRILHALEGLFVDVPEQPSFVVACVPAWLKFSYLSELLEASLADISYLFDEGALIDFETHELIELVRALFADTPQRANMINKLMAGHSHSP